MTNRACFSTILSLMFAIFSTPSWATQYPTWNVTVNYGPNNTVSYSTGTDGYLNVSMQVDGGEATAYALIPAGTSVVPYNIAIPTGATGSQIQLGVVTYTNTVGFSPESAILNPNIIQRTGANYISAIEFTNSLPAGQSRALVARFTSGTTSPINLTTTASFESTPKLNMAVVNGSCTMTYSNSVMPWILEMNTNLDNMTAWTPVTGGTTNFINGNVVRKFPATGPQKFFRLLDNPER